MRAVLVILLIVISLACPSLAEPVIESLEISPHDAWFGENVLISIYCTNGNSSVNAYATIFGPNLIIPFLELAGKNPYNITLDNYYLDRTGEFNVTVFCTSENQTVSERSSFMVSEYTASISGIQPNPSYLGNVIDIYMNVRKGSTPLTSGVNFTVFLESNEQQLKINPVYDTIKGWILRIDAPAIPGTYNLRVNASYGRTSLADYDTIEVREDIVFDIMEIDNTWIKPDDVIYLSLSALDKGAVIGVNKNNLRLEIGSAQADIKSITLSGNVFSIKFTAPYNPPGSYNLKATLSYNNYSFTATEKIEYVVHVSGKFVDVNGKALSVGIKFFLNSYEKLNLITDGSGSYSGYVPVDKYDLHFIFPKSTLFIEGAFVDEFEDAVSYSYLSGASTPGIASNAVHAYGINMPFDEAKIEIRYNEGDVDETSPELFRCSGWSFSKNSCTSNWEETTADIDTSRNIVTLRTETLSAFAIGSKDKLMLSFNIDKTTAGLREPVEITGISQNSKGEPVSNVSIEALIKNTGIKEKTYSDNNGVFTLRFISPEKEGYYNLYIDAEKEPYRYYESQTKLEVKKSVLLSLIFPDSVRISPGQNMTQEIKLVNSGQADIGALVIDITGIKEEYYKLDYSALEIPAGKEKILYLYLSIPPDEDLGTSAAKISVSGENISREKTFGFTVESQKQKQETNDQPGSMTGLAIGINLPVDNTALFLLSFALVSFSLAFFIKRRKKSSQRNEISQTLSEIKNQIRKKDENIVPVSLPADITGLDDNYKYE